MRRVMGWMPWHHRSEQVILGAYTLTLDQANALEAYLRQHSVVAFVCPSIKDERRFSVTVRRRDRRRAGAALVGWQPGG